MDYEVALKRCEDDRTHEAGEVDCAFEKCLIDMQCLVCGLELDAKTKCACSCHEMV